jgi:hypothetical protein
MLVFNSSILQRDYPAKFIYEPWTAPVSVQTAAHCLIGSDYPQPMVDHAIASQENKDKIAAAYAVHNEKKEESDGASKKKGKGVKRGGDVMGSILAGKRRKGEERKNEARM